MNSKLFFKGTATVLVIFLLTGCYSSQILNYDEFDEQEIIVVITRENDTLSFENDQNILVANENDTLKYRTANNDIKTVSKDDVESIIISTYSGSKTTALVLGSVAATAIFASLLIFVLPAE